MPGPEVAEEVGPVKVGVAAHPDAAGLISHYNIYFFERIRISNKISLVIHHRLSLKMAPGGVIN